MPIFIRIEFNEPERRNLRLQLTCQLLRRRLAGVLVGVTGLAQVAQQLVTAGQGRERGLPGLEAVTERLTLSPDFSI
jgi:hypothetical protein